MPTVDINKNLETTVANPNCAGPLNTDLYIRGEELAQLRKCLHRTGQRARM